MNPNRHFIPCSFVNGNPTNYGPDLGYLVIKELDGELTLKAVRENYYPHPDAPDDAILSVKEQHVVTRAKEGDENFPILNMLLMAQKACKNIVRRTI